MHVELDVPATMRDGVVLRANVYRPDGEGPWPTLLMRTPYAKDDAAEILWCGLDPVGATRHGLMVVIQDTRGRGASDGEWVPFRFEAQDGFDTVQWAAGLPGANGRVAMYGGSYCGNTQWLAAAEQPSALVAIAPLMTWADPNNGVWARGGAVELTKGLTWGRQMHLEQLTRLGLEPAERDRRLEELVDELDRFSAEPSPDLSVNDVLALADRGIQEFGVRGLEDDEIAQRTRVVGRHERVDVPSMHIGGWHDLALQGTLDNYQAMVALGREARLVIGPWTHDAVSDPIGELAYGSRGSLRGVPFDPASDVIAMQQAWLRRQLTGDAAIEIPEAPVRIFVMGRNRWREEPAWPLERAVAQRWFLQPDGSLATATPDADANPSTFTYDPAQPVPTVGGPIRVSSLAVMGPADQRSIEQRDDVLVFTSEPLEEELEVTGPIRVVLHAASSAVATDWVARLCDVYPDGRSMNLCDGILRVGSSADQLQRHEINLWSTCNVFLAGHRIRVHVTSSSYPRWDRNRNTGDQRGSEQVTARQQIHHGAAGASYIELPAVT